MRSHLLWLLFFQRFFIPVMLLALVWAIWRTLARKDVAAGLALYAALIVVVDGFYNTAIYIPGIAQGSIRYSEIWALALFAVLPRRQPGDAPQVLLRFLVYLYFFMLLIAALRADPLMSGLYEFRKVAFPQLLTFYLASRTRFSAEDYKRFALWLGGLVLIVGVFCFWDVFFDIHILHSDVLGKPEYYHNRRLGRFGSLFLNPNLLGAFVVLMFPMMLAVLLDTKELVKRLYFVALVLALAFCLMQTQSRAPAAVFMGIVLVFVMVPVAGISRTRRMLVVAATAALVFSFSPGFIKHMTKRFQSQDQEIVVTTLEPTAYDEGRASMWKYTRRLIAENPVLGIGMGEAQFLAAIEKTDYALKYGKALDNPHNSYLQAAVYAGIPTLMIFLAANVILLLRARRAPRATRGPSYSAPAVLGLSVGIFGFLVCAYVDMHLFTFNVGPMYWMFFGLLLSVVARGGTEAAATAGVTPAAGAGRAPARPLRARG